MRFSLESLTTVAGAHTYTQDELADALRAELKGLPDGGQMAQMVGFVYGRSGIRARHLEVPPDEARSRPDWYQLVNEATFTLACRAIDTLLNRGHTVDEFDGMILVSASHSGFPGLGRRLQDRYKIAPDAVCYDIAATGCGGPPQGLGLGQALLEQGRCERLLIVCVDVMGTHGAAREHQAVPSIAQLVAHCLASDGAAALVMSSAPGPQAFLTYERGAMVTRLWPGSLDLNDFTADEENQPYISVGKDIRTRLLDELGGMLAVAEGPVLMHPGGAALMRILTEHFPERRAELDLALSILEDNGNMGAPSALWVLRRALERGLEIDGEAQLFALGPGIVSTLYRFEGAKSHGIAHA